MKVGIIGLGKMGEAMAGHVLARGDDSLAIFDLDPAPVDRVGPLGHGQVDQLVKTISHDDIQNLLNGEQASYIGQIIAANPDLFGGKSNE